jgi:hypothetical protein
VGYFDGGLSNPPQEKQIPRARKKAARNDKIEKANGPQQAAGRPVDCCGLTKRWSLYVASSATPGLRLATLLTDLRQAESILYSPVVCGL